MQTVSVYEGITPQEGSLQTLMCGDIFFGRVRPPPLSARSAAAPARQDVTPGPA
jgi:hypothetical protein